MSCDGDAMMISRRSRQPVVSAETAARAVEGVGQHLRAARTARGEALEAAAAALCIRPGYLTALEMGNLQALPGRPYAVGFLRSYATHLGLDADTVLGEARPALDQLAAPPAPVYRQPVAEGRRIGVKLATASMLLLGALYGGYLVIHRGQEMAPDRITDMTGGAERLAGTGGDRRPTGEAPAVALPLPTPAELASLAPPAAAQVLADASPRPEAMQASSPRVAAAAAPISSATGSAAGVASDPGVAQAASPPSGASPPQPDVASAAAAEAAPERSTMGTILSVPAAPLTPVALRTASAVDPAGDPGNQVVLVATESSWVQIRSPDRDFFKMGTLEPGERLVLPDRTDLALWTGNAGGLQIEVGGKTLGTPGRRGQVVKDLPLTPGQLEARLIR